jgi:chromosome segregation ATPase
MSDPQERIDSVKESLDAANGEIEATFNAIEGHHADLIQRQQLLRALVAAYRTREKELSAYAAELTHKRDSLALIRTDVTAQAEKVQADMDEEIALTVQTLSNVTQELALLVERQETAQNSTNSIGKRVERLQEEEAKLNEQEKTIDLQITEFTNAAPSPPPEELAKEATLLKDNIRAAMTAISATERQIAAYELVVVSLQSKHGTTTERLATLAEESGAQEGRASAALPGLQCEISVANEAFCAAQAKQLELNGQIERMREKKDVLTAAVRTSSASSRKTFNRIEQLKDAMESATREIENRRELTSHCKALTADLRKQRSERDGQRASELCQIRAEFRKTRLKIGRLQKASELETEHELTEAVKKLAERLEAEDARRQHLAELARELKRANAESQSVLHEREIADMIEMLNQLQKGIAIAEGDRNDIREEALRLARPFIVEREKDPEPEKPLKRKLRVLNRRNEKLRYSISMLETQIESRRQELFLAKVNCDHATNLTRAFEPDDSVPVRMASLRRMETAKRHLIAKIERMDARIANRKMSVDLKKSDLANFAREMRVREFGNNVTLVICPRPPAPRKAPRVADIDNLTSCMRCIQLERRLWYNYVDPVSAKAHLDSWQSQLDRFADY